MERISSKDVPWNVSPAKTMERLSSKNRGTSLQQKPWNVSLASGIMKIKESLIITTILTTLLPNLVWAQEETPVPAPARAVWMPNTSEEAPWLDLRPNEVQIAAPKLIATGNKVAIIQNSQGETVAVDDQLNFLGTLAVTPEIQWIGMDGQDRLLIYDGKVLAAAQNWEEAKEISGFFPIMELTDARHLESAGHLIGFTRDNKLSLIHIEEGTTKEITLADFMDDTKIAAMTPEAVAKAEEEAANPKKKSKFSKNKTSEPETVSTVSTLPPEVTGFWIRPDDTVVIRVRRMLSTRTFISKDMGRSWTQIEAAPDQLVREGGWIWDGEHWVLNREGTGFVEITGESVNLFDRLNLTHRPEIAPALPQNWINRESPEPDESESPIEVGKIARFQSENSPVSLQSKQRHYQPQEQESGTIFGFYHNASCPEGQLSCAMSVQKPPTAWMMTPDHTFSEISLPEGCIPAYIGNARGLGVLMCQHESSENEWMVYVRTAESDWVPETILPDEFAQNTEILSASEGTVALAGDCVQEVVTFPAEDEATAPIEREARVCRVAVRMPYPVGSQNIWHIERLIDPQNYALESDGRLLVVEPSEDGASRLVLRQTNRAEILVENFDPSPYHGVVLTDEGCLALDDGTQKVEQLRANAEGTRLLSVQGGLAGLNCSTSQLMAESELNGNMDIEESLGDDRYGLRLGAGAFFAQDSVHTWFMRLEGIIPVYGGQYEVGLMYRMAGGNKSNAMGHLGVVSIRWRYDGLEMFDFAVGAGIGFGQMCGYTAPPTNGNDAETNEEAEENTKKSGYEKCNNASMRYQITGIATYHLADQWKLYIDVELIGGSTWGIDVGAGIEIRF